MGINWKKTLLPRNRREPGDCVDGDKLAARRAPGDWNQSPMSTTRSGKCSEPDNVHPLKASLDGAANFLRVLSGEEKRLNCVATGRETFFARFPRFFSGL